MKARMAATSTRMMLMLMLMTMIILMIADHHGERNDADDVEGEGWQ